MNLCLSPPCPLLLLQSVVLDKASVAKLKTVLLETAVMTSVPYIIMALGILFGALFVALVCKPFRAREEVR